MNQVNSKKRECFDTLSLKIEPNENGRLIVPCSAEADVFVSEDGQIYEDQTWRVKIYNQQLFAYGRRNMISVIYKGEREILGDSYRRATHQQFDTGYVSVSFENAVRKSGELESQIAVHSRGYDGVLRDEFGIYDGFVFDSPNRIFDIGRHSDYCLLVVSDGEVFCEHNGIELKNPTAMGDLLVVEQGDTLCYEVQKATWVVALRQYFNDEDGVAEIGLYTQTSNFQIVLDKLEEYLLEHELTRFDELL